MSSKKDPIIPLEKDALRRIVAPPPAGRVWLVAMTTEELLDYSANLRGKLAALRETYSNRFVLRRKREDPLLSGNVEGETLPKRVANRHYIENKKAERKLRTGRPCV